MKGVLDENIGAWKALADGEEGKGWDEKVYKSSIGNIWRKNKNLFPLWRRR